MVDYVGRIFEALVERWIPEQPVATFDCRQNGLAFGRRTAARKSRKCRHRSKAGRPDGDRSPGPIPDHRRPLQSRARGFPPARLISWIASAVPRKCSVSVTAVSPVRENRTPTLHVSGWNAVLLTIDMSFTESSGWVVTNDRRPIRHQTVVVPEAWHRDFTVFWCSILHSGAASFAAPLPARLRSEIFSE